MQIDEGALALFSRESMTLSGRNMVKIFMTIRRKSLFTTVCIPSYRDLDKYIREHRVHLLINVTGRGKYTAYFGDAINKINQDIPKVKKINAVTVPSEYFFQGYFNKQYPDSVPEDEYNKKKDKHIDEFLKVMEKESEREEKLPPKMYDTTTVAKRLNRTSKQIWERIQKGDLKAKRIGKKYYIPETEFQIA